MIKLFLITFFVLITFSCVTLKPHEQIYINDSDMDLSIKAIDTFEINFHIYREGSSGANGGKIGGGCGCN